MSADATVPEGEVVSRWLARAVELGASDLHIIVGYRPTLRLHCGLVELNEPVLIAEAARTAITPLCPPRAWKQLEEQKNVDFAFELNIAGRSQRYRMNVFVSGPNTGACIRVIQSESTTGRRPPGFIHVCADARLGQDRTRHIVSS